MKVKVCMHMHFKLSFHRRDVRASIIMRRPATIVILAIFSNVGHSASHICEHTESIPPELSSPPIWPVSEDLPRLEPCRDRHCATVSPDFNEDVDLNFLLYTRLNPTIAQRLRAQSKSLGRSNFSAQRYTKILVHGWIASIRSPNYRLMQVVRQTYLSFQDVNVIFVDWSRRAHGPYLRAAGNSVAAGLALGRFLEALIQQGTRPSSIHIVGHSLGAHVAGVAGFSLSEEMALGRITGLDPAGWLFETPRLQPASLRLSSAAADFVDVVHTTGGLTGLGVGSSGPLGHADFYANRGEAPQPGCHRRLSLSCSHARAILLFIDSIHTPMSLLATKCAGWPIFEDGLCNNNRRAPMGEAAHRGLRGLYFLRTNHQHPYGMGNQGSYPYGFTKFNAPSNSISRGLTADEL